MRRTSKAVFLPASDEPYVFVEALPDATSARALRRILPLMNLYRASAFQARVPIRRLTIAESETASGLGIVVLVAQFRRAFRADSVQGPYAVPGSLLFGAHVPRIAVPFTRPGMASRAGALRNRSDDPAEVRNRLTQALFEAHARLPAEQRPGFGDIGFALLRVVLVQDLEDDFRSAAGHAADVIGELENRHLARISQVHRIPLRGEHEAIESIHQVADVAETAGLGAVAEDGHGFASQGPIEERRHHAAIVQLHARAVGVKDAGDVGAHAVRAVIGHGEGFGEAFAFVIAGARAHRIHVAPIRLHLRMHQRIAIALAGGGLQKARVLFERQF